MLDFRCFPAHTFTMRKRVYVPVAFLLVAIVGVITWQVLHEHEREPVYQGKRLSAWLREYRSALNVIDGDREEAGKTARNAIQAIGTNAIPTLVRMLGKKDSFVVSKLLALWNRHFSSLPRWARYPGWLRHQAAFLNNYAEHGFEILGADAQQAVPALIALYEQNVSPYSQVATSRALIAIGPAAQRMAIPSFLRAAASSNAPARNVAVQALSGVDAEQRQVVPALTAALSDTNFVIRMVAASGLGRFGTNAEQAVPALVLMLSDPSPQVRPEATNALKRIDPEAAARAGVK